MNDQPKKPDATSSEPPAAKAPGGAEMSPSGEAATEHMAMPDAAALAAEVETLNGQIDNLTDRLLRAHAEMDNFRKRTEREREETAKYAITKFARDVVNVGDNFQRAISAVPPDAGEKDPALASFLEGVTLAEREFLNVLERHGIHQIDPAGQPFNPHQHQAVMEQDNPDVPPGTVLQVFQPGFMIEDRCLRPAMVVVAKGGQKAAKVGGDSSNGPQSGPKTETPDPEPKA